MDGRGPLLGLGDTDGHRAEAEFSFDTGDILVLYTDGLVERRDESIDVGLDRLLECLDRGRELAPDELCDRVLTEMAAEQPADDVALLILRRSTKVLALP